MKTIIIPYAFSDEYIYFSNKYNIDINIKESNIVINNNKVIFINTGVGKVNASCSIQRMIDLYKPYAVINCGCLASLTKKLPSNGIIISDKMFYHDFTPKEIMEKYVPNNGTLYSDDNLKKLAVSACQNLNIKDFYIENIASGDCYVTTKDKVYEITKLNVNCVDMEATALAHVCNKNNIPFISIKGISDFADGKDINEETASERASKVVDEMLNII